jgi:photoactive yellow protein
MNSHEPPHFDAADLGSRLSGMSDAELDELPFGVVEMDHGAVVLRYNATESRYSGLPRERVVGRQFFRDVAPCSNNRHVAERFTLDALDETIAYTFSLRMKPVAVTLRMLKAADGGPMYLVVRWK